MVTLRQHQFIAFVSGTLNLGQQLFLVVTRHGVMVARGDTLMLQSYLAFIKVPKVWTRCQKWKK